MKKIVLLMAALCCALLCSSALAAEKANAPKFTLLKADSGNNISEMNFTLISGAALLGSVQVGEAVKFTAPKPGWKLEAVQILGSSPINDTTKTIPADRNFLIEVRDKDLNLLYRLSDTQNVYFGYTNVTVLSNIPIPALPLTGDFYIIFYDRAGMGVGMEQGPGNGTGNSFFYDGGLMPAEFKLKNTNETEKVNWVIRAIGL